MDFKGKCEFHENQNTIGFCLNQQCQNNPEFCYDCRLEKHLNHIQDCFQFNHTNEILQKITNDYDTLKELRNEIKQIINEMTRDFQEFLENNFQKRLDELFKIHESLRIKNYYQAKQNLKTLSQLKTQSQTNQIRLNFEEIKEQCLTFKGFIQSANIYTFKQGQSEYIQNSDIKNSQVKQNEEPIEIFQLCQHLLEEAKQLKNNGEFQKSLETLNEIVSLDKDNNDAHHEQASILFSLGQNEKALQSIQKCLQSNPKNGRGYFLKGNILLKQYNYREAIPAFEKAENFPENISSQLYAQLAFSLSNCQNYQKAVDYCDKAIQFDSECAAAYNNKASALKNLQKYDEALMNYNRAVELSPGSDDYIINKGVLLYERNRFNEALEEFEKASLVNQQNPRLYLNKGQLLQRMNKYEEALQCYNLLVQLDPYNQEGQQLLNQLLNIMVQNSNVPKQK